jgi:uncharacterized protein (UPF0548 family)
MPATSRAERRLTGPGTRTLLDELPRRRLNFDLRALRSLSAEEAWHVDDYCRELPSEPPGPPIPGGSFEVARRLMGDYEFADPSVIRAVYESDAPLEGRNMLLEIRFAGLRFRVPVRIEEVRDEVREVEGRAVRVWGWAYRTLEGHLEKGQMDYEVWKWVDDGRVEFRIHAVSEMAEIRNPFVRIGFRLFGRREQVRFARRCGERLVRFTRAVLDRGEEAEPRPAVVEGLAVSPTRPLA